MPGPARIDSADVLRETKAMLAQFAETAALALVAVDADIARMKQWLNSERPFYWKRRIRELEDAVEAAKAEIRRKEIVVGKDPVSVVDERRRLKRAQARLDDARQRAEATRRWGPAWERESMLYKSSCTPLTNALYAEIPQAIARLDRMLESLEEYLRLAAPTGEAGGLPVVSPPPEGEQQVSPPIPWIFAPPDPRDLRRYVPTPASVAGPADRALMRLDWPAGEPAEADQKALRALAGSTDGISPDDTLILAWRATTEPSVFFVRTDSASPPQSGWYVGPVEQPDIPGGYRVCRIGEMIEQFPGLLSIFCLTPGSLLILTRGAVKTVLDGNDREVWAPPPGVEG